MAEHKQTGIHTDLKAIARVRDPHVAALNTGDAKARAAQSDDAVQMPPNAPGNVGRTKSTHHHCYAPEGMLDQLPQPRLTAFSLKENRPRAYRPTSQSILEPVLRQDRVHTDPP
jgi:hypothetical protein